MRILGRARLNEFARDHANARSPLARWEQIVKAAIWNNLADLKRTFRSADLVGDKIVFNIGGNNFRLMAIVDFRATTVLVTDVMTHQDYSKQR